MNTSLSIRIMLAAGALACSMPSGAQQAPAGNPAAAALAAALPAPAPTSPAGAAPAKPQGNGAANAASAPPVPDVLDPKAEEERRKAEEALRAKRDEARRIKAELQRGCVIRPVMSDAEIAKCR